MIPPSNPERVSATVWARQGSYLVADIGTPEGRTVSSLWHDDVCAREDGSTFTTSGNRQCTPWTDADEWERKSADLDRVVAILTAHNDLVAALQSAVGLLKAEYGNMGERELETRVIRKCDAVLAKAVQS